MSQPIGPSAREKEALAYAKFIISPGGDPGMSLRILCEEFLALESLCTAQQQRIERLEATLREIIAIGNDPMENTKNGYAMQATAEKCLAEIEDAT